MRHKVNINSHVKSPKTRLQAKHLSLSHFLQKCKVAVQETPRFYQNRQRPCADYRPEKLTRTIFSSGRLRYFLSIKAQSFFKPPVNWRPLLESVVHYVFSHTNHFVRRSVHGPYRPLRGDRFDRSIRRRR